MNKSRLEYLFIRYYDKTCTPEEKAELINMLGNDKNDAATKNLIDEVLINTGQEMELDNVTADSIMQAILKADPKKQKPAVIRPIKRLHFTRIAAASIIFLLLSIGGYFYFNNKAEKQVAKTETPNQRLKNDVAPGGNKAMLTLADGSQIVLDSAKNGTISQQGNTKIIKLDNGELAYQSGSSPSGEAEVRYNTISTPKGGQYQIVLADGSKVWLNAASSLKFPASFTGKERNVELTGEGYFEVKHDASKPFSVTVNGMRVEDLGTHFNINAYSDESSMKTTLLEGSVKVTPLSTGGEGQGVRLKPGQQAILTVNGQLTTDNHVDLEEVMAWKEGFFHFESADLKTILREFARWYDVEIIYAENISDKKYFCIVNKNISLANVLKALQASDLKFRIDGKKLFVQ